MADNRYYGGITVGAAGFEIGAQAPVDSRFRVKNAEGLLELLTYEGLVSYNEADKKYYRFADGEWKTLSVNTPAELETLIKDLIATETTGAMEFKGATASLPENPGKGDMYKVSGQFAVGEETAKVGDTIVYNGEQWFLIPSGDDIEDTWRPVKVGENTLDQTETLEFVAGDNVTITENAGKVTISSSYEDTHYESKLVVGNESADAADESVVENGNVHLNLVEDGVVRSSHKIVGAGGITVTHAKAEGEDGVNTITIEAPEGAKYDLAAKTENDEAILSLAGTDNTEDKVAIVGNDAVAVTVEGGKIKVSAHDTKYTGSEGEEIKVIATDDGAITAELTEAVRTKLDKVWEEVDVAAGLVEALAEGQVKANKEAIEAINDETNGILAKANAEIAKDRERLDELEKIDHDAYIAADATLKAELQKEIDDDVKVVSDYVGTFTHGTAKTVVEYVDEKTKGIATEGAMTALEERVTAVEGEIDVIQGDYVKHEEIADFETKENVQKVADDLAAEVKARDDADKDFETRIGTLEGKFGTGEGTVEAQIAAAVAAEKARAEEIEGGLREDVDLAASDIQDIWEAIGDGRGDSITGQINGLYTMVGANDGITQEYTIVDYVDEKASEVQDAANGAAAQALADAKTYANEELAKKADKSVVDAMYTNGQIDTAVQGAKDYAKGLVDAIPDAPVYSLKKAADSGAYAAVYNLTRDGEIVGDTINIPKDMVVEEGKVVENPEGQNPGTYIELKLQNVTKPLYINVGDLIEYVTSGSAADDAIVVAVSEDHKVTATITDGKITLAKLEKDVQDAIALAKTALQEHQDITGKADKVTGAVAGNFAGLDANGNLVDSGVKADDLTFWSDLSAWVKEEQIYHTTEAITVDAPAAMEYTWSLFLSDFGGDLLVRLNEDKYLYSPKAEMHAEGYEATRYWYYDRARTLYSALNYGDANARTLVSSDKYQVIDGEEAQAIIAQGGYNVRVITEVNANPVSTGDTYVGNAITSVEWDASINNGLGGLKFTKGTQFATKAELDAALEAFGGDLSAITDNNTKYTFAVPTEGENAGKLVVTEINYVNGVAEGSGTATAYDFTTEEEIEIILSGYYTNNQVDEIIDGIDQRVETLEKAGHISEITTTPNNGLKVTNKNNIDIDDEVIFVLDCNW